MSEQDNTLPPLPEPELGMPWRVNAKSDGSAHSSGWTYEQMLAYGEACRAAGRREVEEAVGAGGVNSAFTLALRETAKWFPNGMADEALKRSNP